MHGDTSEPSLTLGPLLKYLMFADSLKSKNIWNQNHCGPQISDEEYSVCMNLEVSAAETSSIPACVLPSNTADFSPSTVHAKHMHIEEFVNIEKIYLVLCPLYIHKTKINNHK